ncbi:hypothetical protein MNBD_ALPHA04-2270 [hydrothermal vent metagenome]|uniref:Uncharacterized protein n=1 Tax=hydrothermal vent metagenome TaxID=652676 RepID=A0A3B0SDL3_9ZZZZ
MLLSQSTMRTMMAMFTAILTTGLLFTASASQARGSAVIYTAELQTPVEATRHIIKGTVVYCAGTMCKAAKSTSSTRSLCAKIADKVGPLASFSYKGELIDEEALAKCNS